MLTLDVWIDQEQVGRLTYEPTADRYALHYGAHWRRKRRAPLSPHLPIDGTPVSAQAHSAEVRDFFANLLPEGPALEVVAQAHRIPKTNIAGLLLVLGHELPGAVRLTVTTADRNAAMAMVQEPPSRPVMAPELSSRIRIRDRAHFSVWDGRVRLSLAGYQDKTAFFEQDEHWHLVDGGHASTVILKPAPQREGLTGLASNEFLCMRLARRAGIPAAEVRLEFVPEPVLVVERFDRRHTGGTVKRLHVIDGCQALGLPPNLKYERPYRGATDDARVGASYAQLFRLFRHEKDHRALLRWAIYQVLIGNMDAHAKNLSFFCDAVGLRLTPAYDLVSITALGDPRLAQSFAMGIGDAFTADELTAAQWARFADHCGLPPAMVAGEVGGLALQVLGEIDAAIAESIEAGADARALEAVRNVVVRNCERQRSLAAAIEADAARPAAG